MLLPKALSKYPSSSGSFSLMEGTKIEVCIVSGKGLKKSSPWKQQWFAVGWIDPKDKYCTKIDNSGSSSPTWNTKFSAIVSGNSVLTVELYSRDPFFLREKLHGIASIALSEFLYLSADPQLETLPLKNKKGRSPLPRGFVRVSIRLADYEEVEKPDVSDGNFHYPKRENESSTESAPRRRGTPPPPAPPENVGFIPSFFPPMKRSSEGTEDGGVRSDEAAAMAAGALIFGDDFLWAGNFRGP